MTRGAGASRGAGAESDGGLRPAGALCCLVPAGLAVPALDPLVADGRAEVRRLDGPLGAGDVPPGRPVLVVAPADLLAALADGPVGAAAALVDAAEATGAVLRQAARAAWAIHAARTAREAEAERINELRELTRIGAALSTERDLLRLLGMILTQARRITASDAGSLYLIEREEGAAPCLRFKLAQNASRPEVPYTEFTVPLDRASLAGYVATTGTPVVLDDAYHLPPDAPYGFNRSFDEGSGYRTRSMLVVPMRTQRDDVIGVLQLINRKRDADARLADGDAVAREVLPFDPHTTELVEALASQAAVAIESSRLYEDIERLFEGFVQASVTAIEQRDPTTSGHSFRVAALTVGLAEAVDRTTTGPYAGLRFSRDELRELRYACLLHDFGKVGVREQVLVKQKKLYGPDLALIRQRFHLLLQQADLEFERERAAYLQERGRAGYAEVEARLEQARHARRDELSRFLDAIVRSNEPTILPEGAVASLREINARTYTDADGVTRSLLSDDELRFLMIDRGNLDDRERREIETHVSHSYAFLRQIPWTRDLKGIPHIAFAHHEKLDGTGYPRRLSAPDIPVQTRMMTISDIFDALTATDRPYKRAVPVERALDILHAEARGGAIDPALLETFVEARVWETT